MDRCLHLYHTVSQTYLLKIMLHFYRGYWVTLSYCVKTTLYPKNYTPDIGKTLPLGILTMLTVIYLQPMNRVVHCSVGKKHCIAAVSYNVWAPLYPSDPLQYTKDLYHCHVYWGPLRNETNSDPFRNFDGKFVQFPLYCLEECTGQLRVLLSNIFDWS